ncbi:short-chain collagen C4-like [Lytechinus variegatus]|uniref:short-chain collagen C4-like n=1 Tax=Lytechinus variegatus TaxID=7654 RepID=UPI001BB0E968|nr:short-chain collagen C4-like [Lytechinus variegatus]
MMVNIHIPDPLLMEPRTRRRRELRPYSWPMYSGKCFLCPAAVPGEKGFAGPQGVPGRDGRDGRDAPINDAPCPPIEEPKPTLNPEPTEASKPTEAPPVENATLPRVVYIRWGHDECPEGAELIYSGSMGGSNYGHTGSGANHLCMPDEPVYDEHVGSNSDRALLYSTEYMLPYSPNTRISEKNAHAPTCAVCRAPSGRTTKLMIPARNICPDDKWRLEYAGYLMAGKSTLKRSKFICVDREMIPIPGTQGSQGGGYLYLTEMRCVNGGGLDCGPYVNGYEITCAVCTM